ncbi:MAG: alpha/beta hydrolase [Sedimentisphaerales bacterium]|nr:alpha/beta hydrolase [Sedimentisphaerales bacterium]
MKKIILKSKNIIILCAMTVLFAVSCSTPTQNSQNRYAKSFDGEQISYNVYGEGDIALLFVHGWSCDGRYWREQVPHFAEEYCVITMDLAGHGKSGQHRKVYSLDGFAQDVKAVIEAANPKKVILIGHSFGGEIIASTVKLEPEKVIGIIGADTLHNLDETFTKEEGYKLIGLDGMKKDFKPAVREFVKQMMAKDVNHELSNWIINDMSSAPRKAAINMLEEYVGAIADKKTIDIFKEVKVPVICINADLWPTNIEANKRYMTSFDVKIMKGAGHFLMLERPEEFNSLLDSSIKEIIGN